MAYTFEILGVSPVLYYFTHQQEVIQTKKYAGVEYLGTYQCTLDAFLESVEEVPGKHGWDFEQLVQTVVNFWVNNSDNICYWRERLKDAGSENLLVSRIADIRSLRAEFESLFGLNR